MTDAPAATPGGEADPSPVDTAGAVDTSISDPSNASARTLSNPETNAADPVQAEPETPEAAEPEIPQAPLTSSLTDADLKAIREFGLDPDEIMTMEVMNPKQRELFISGLTRRHTELNEQIALARKAQTQAPQQHAQPEADPEAEKLWGDFEKHVVEIYGTPEAAAPFTKSMRGLISASTAGMTKQFEKDRQEAHHVISNLGDMIEEMHFQQAINEGKFPAGLNKTNEKLLTQLRARAEIFKSGSFHPTKFNMKHATERAIDELSARQAQEERKAKQANAGKTALRGSAAPAPTGSTVRSRMTDDQWTEEKYKAVKAGDTARLKELENL